MSTFFRNVIAIFGGLLDAANPTVRYPERSTYIQEPNFSPQAELAPTLKPKTGKKSPPATHVKPPATAPVAPLASPDLVVSPAFKLVFLADIGLALLLIAVLASFYFIPGVNLEKAQGLITTLTNLLTALFGAFIGLLTGKALK